ncbi:hypothetical protein DM02DRAFT_686833 [Periconia macrospinosa]|uniref:Rhodopsin domain-containing protein n=1 Tax=Periconia macrospinosa TaxID=97972 RepID=A0A2V1DFM1_9PLEO|nr:hypothetical protein DM02DRAFT_686833 [Periconia macrospinosa]
MSSQPSQITNWVSNPDETRGPMAAVTLWSLWAVSTLFLFLRLSIRFTSGKLWIDDIFLVISWLALLAQVITQQLGINLGLGKHVLDIPLANFDQIMVYGASGLTLSIVAINMSKISFGITLFRLTTGWPRHYICFSIVTLVIFAFPPAIMPWVLCKPIAKAFIDIIPGTCIDRTPSIKFAQFQAIWSGIIDVSFAFLPWVILWKLDMRIPEKIGVGVAMSLGVLAGVTALVRGHYVNELNAKDISYDAASSVIWSVAETVATIVATSVPVVRPFIIKAVDSAVTKYRSTHSSSESGRTTGATEATSDHQSRQDTMVKTQLSSKEPPSKPDQTRSDQIRLENKSPQETM